jgi:hypothetical protein
MNDEQVRVDLRGLEIIQWISGLQNQVNGTKSQWASSARGGYCIPYSLASNTSRSSLGRPCPRSGKPFDLPSPFHGSSIFVSHSSRRSYSTFSCKQFTPAPISSTCRRVQDASSVLTCNHGMKSTGA